MATVSSDGLRKIVKGGERKHVTFEISVFPQWDVAQ